MFSRCFKYLPWVFLFWLHFAVGTGGADLLPGAPGANPDRQRDRENQRQERRQDEGRRERGSSASSRSRPPLPLPRSEAVSRGEAVAIILSARGKYGETVDFMIREEPRHGTLSKMTRLRQDSVQVTYRHGGETSAASDKFTYAAQSRGSRVSAPATVTIAIEEVPGQLRVPRELDFGEVIVGESARKPLRVRNPAGGPVETEVRLPEPFRLLRPEKVRPALALEARDEVLLEVLFSPRGPGAHRDPIVYTSMPGTYTMLVAKAVAPIEVSPATLQLQRGGQAPGIATAQLSVKNLAATQRVVALEPSGQLRVVPVQTVKPGATEQVRVALHEPPATGFDGEIRLSTEHFDETVAVTLASLPPKLRVEPELLDFQRVTRGENPVLPLKLSNTGGKALTELAVLVEGQFGLAEGSESIEVPSRLEPGAQQELLIRLKPDQRSGRVTGVVSISAEEVETKTIPLHAQVMKLAPEDTEQKPPTPSAGDVRRMTAAAQIPTAVSASSDLTAVEDREEEAPGRDWDNLIPDYAPVIRGVATGVKDESVVLLWPKESGIANPLVQEQVLEPSDENLLISWVSVPVAEYLDLGEAYGLILSDREAGTISVFRLVSRDLEPLSMPVSVEMPLKQTRWGKIVIRALLFLFMAGAIILLYYRRKEIMERIRTLGEYRA